MKKILFTWELGAGLGHIIHIKKLASHFLANGDTVYVALMDLSHAASVFAGMDVKLLQAPYKTGFRANPIIPPMSFSQLIHNNGFSREQELQGLVRSWQTLYDLVVPDIIFFDHCPSALVAARAYNCLKVTMGVGFSSPPPATPFGVFTQPPGNVKKMVDDDRLVLANTNRVLDSIGAVPLSTLDQLFYDGIKTCFLSLPEFDHYQPRDESLYYGPVLSATGIKPKWPGKHKKKVYLYLKQFQGIMQLFKMLAGFPLDFIVYTNNVPDNVIKASAAPNLRFQQKPLDLSLVGEQADLAVVNAGHSTLCQFILAGVPVLMLPLQMEQQMLAVRMFQQNTGWIADTENKNFFQSVHNTLSGLSNGLTVSYDIRDRYAGADFDQQQQQMCEQISGLV